MNDLKEKQVTVKDYCEAEKAENELNFETDNIRKSLISVDASTSAANGMADLHMACAIAVSLESTAEYFKRNPVSYVRGQDGEAQGKVYNKRYLIA